MLASFKVANFLSFKEMQSFSMIPGNYDSHQEHIINKTVKILDRAIMYGPNSSGKSNFISAIAYAQRIAVGTNYKNFTYRIKTFEDMSYCNGDDVRDPISYFEFQLYIDNNMYSYGFEYNTKFQSFVSEWLVQLYPNGDERTIFNLTFEEKVMIETESEEDRFIAGDHTTSDKSFLSKSSQKDAQAIYQWILKKLTVVTSVDDHSGNRSTHSLLKIDDFNHIMNELKRLDTGIDGITSLNDPWVNRTLEQISKGITHTLSSKLDKEYSLKYNDPTDKGYVLYEDGEKYHLPKSILVNINRNSFSIRLYRSMTKDYIDNHKNDYTPPLNYDFIGKDSAENVSLCFTHIPNHFKISFADESEGTRRVIEVLMLMYNSTFDTSNQDYTLIIDEFECSIHVLLIREFFNIYNKIRKERQMQFIVSTHESRLLDHHLFRNDEVWFMDIVRNSGSNLYSLSDYVDVNEKTMDLEYLAGKYGATPFVKKSKIEGE